MRSSVPKTERGIRNPSRRQSTSGNLGADVPHMVLPTLRSHVNPIKPKIVHIYTPSGLRISTTNPHGTPPIAVSAAGRNQQQQQQQQQQVEYGRVGGGGGEDEGVNAKYVSAFQLRPTSHAYSRLAGLQASAIYHQHSNQLHQPQIRDKTRGLRHFSMKVCQKVKEKRITTYNEVADELVQEYCAQMAAAAAVTASHTATTFPASQLNRHNLSASELFYDHKNIRRRVYDAINVLMAMNIITKEKKEIRWIGFPSNAANECKILQKEMSVIDQNIVHKTDKLRELILKYVCYEQLIRHNAVKYAAAAPAAPAATAVASAEVLAASRMPLLVMSFPKGSELTCYINPDGTKHTFVCDHEATLIEDATILLAMGFANGISKGGASREEVDQAKAFLPKIFRGYITELAQTGSLTPMFNIKEMLFAEGGGGAGGAANHRRPASRHEQHHNHHHHHHRRQHHNQQQQQRADDDDDSCCDVIDPDDSEEPTDKKRFRSRSRTAKQRTAVRRNPTRKIIKHQPKSV